MTTRTFQNTQVFRVCRIPPSMVPACLHRVALRGELLLHRRHRLRVALLLQNHLLLHALHLLAEGGEGRLALPILVSHGTATSASILWSNCLPEGEVAHSCASYVQAYSTPTRTPCAWSRCTEGNSEDGETDNSSQKAVSAECLTAAANSCLNESLKTSERLPPGKGSAIAGQSITVEN